MTVVRTTRVQKWLGKLWAWLIPLGVAAGLLLGPFSVGPAAADDAVGLVVELTNVERQRAGLPALAANPSLTLAAASYARVLSSEGCWGHACGSVTDFRQRAMQAGYGGWTRLGENLAAGARTPAAVVAAWMASPGHRANILEPDFREIGIGVAYGGPAGVYWVQTFGARRDQAPTQPAASPALTYEVAWLGQSPVPRLSPGDQTVVWVDLLNVGTATWLSGGDNPVRLGTANPQDRPSAFAATELWLSPNRPASLLQGSVVTGQAGRFSFVLTASSVPGRHREYFSPVAEGLTWFNDLGIYFEIEVLP